MYIVTVTNNGETFYLRGTVWAFRAERAFEYDNEPDARIALARARPYMPASVYQAAQVVEVIGVTGDGYAVHVLPDGTLAI